MSKHLRSEHLSFFLARMQEHNRVASCTAIPSDDHYLFRIARTSGLREVKVLLSDVYDFSHAEALFVPRDVDFIVLGLPHALEPDDDLVASLRTRGVGIGHIAKFMGALNSRRLSDYVTREERERLERRT